VRRHDRRLEDSRGGEPDEAPFGRPQGVDAGSAEMVGVTHRHGADAEGTSLVDGEVHCPKRRRLAEAAAAVDHRRGAEVADDANVRRGRHHSGADELVIERNKGDAVAVDAEEIGRGEHVGGHGRLVGRETPSPENRLELPMQPRFRDSRMGVGHGRQHACGPVISRIAGRGQARRGCRGRHDSVRCRGPRPAALHFRLQTPGLNRVLTISLHLWGGARTLKGIG
jgi:hypothetical protein